MSVKKIPFIPLILITIILAASFFRFNHIGHSLPDYADIDEVYAVRTSLGLGLKNLNPKDFVNGGLIYYAFFLLFKAGGVFAHMLSSLPFAESLHPPFDLLNSHILIARFFVASIGVFSVVILYFWVKKIFGRRTALIAAFFLAVNPLHISLSHLACPYVIMVFFNLLAMIFIFKIYEDRLPDINNYIISGVLIGLAAGTKYLSVFLLSPLILAHLFTRRGAKYLFLSLICAAISFLAVNPFVILDYKKFLHDFTRIHAMAKNSFPYAILTTRRGWIGYPVSLIHAMGTGIYLFGAGGIIKAITKRTKKDMILLSFPLTFYIIMGFYRHSFIRDLLSVAPFMAIFAARFAVSLTKTISKRNKVFANKKMLILGVVCLCTAVPSVSGALYHGKWISQEKIRKAVKDWSHENIPRNSKILIDAIGKDVDFIFRKTDIYRIGTIDWEKDPEPAVFFRENEFDYIILDSSRIRPDRMVSFYDYIERHFSFVKKFEPDIKAPESRFDSVYSSFDTTCNPVVKIYRGSIKE